MGLLFPGGTKPTSGSEFRSRVVFRLMWCRDTKFNRLLPCEGARAKANNLTTEEKECLKL
jgi:hypothetical protein